MFKDDRADFESKWQDIQMFTEYGMLMDEKFFERAGKFALYRDTEGQHRTMDELVESLKETHTDKDGNVVMLYTPDPAGPARICVFGPRRRLHGAPPGEPADLAPVQKLEMSAGDTKVQFRRVDSDIVDRLIPKDDAPESALGQRTSRTPSRRSSRPRPRQDRLQGGLCAHEPHGTPRHHHAERVHAPHEGAAARGRRRRHGHVWRHARQL